MLLTERQPKTLNRLEAIDVRVSMRGNARPREKWALTFTLQDWSLIHAFGEICLAFANRIADAPSEDAALRQIHATVDQWQRLLKISRNSDMAKLLRGTFGELVAAMEITRQTGKTIEEVCVAWQGPYAAPQDFQFPDEKTAWEVKTIHKTAESITISSPEQLDTSDRSIKLMVLEIQETKDMEHGLTLPQLVDRLREKAADPSTVTEYVDDGLASLGLNLYSGLVSQTAFRIGTISTYRVEDGFPRIETGTIPAGVSNLTYHISRSNLTPYLQSESTSAMVEE